VRRAWLHAAAELAVTAGDFENPLARLEPEEPLDRRLDQAPLPGAAGFHLLVPVCGERIPRRPDLFECWFELCHGQEVSLTGAPAEATTNQPPTLGAG
jgi:hypothetical protein